MSLGEWESVNENERVRESARLVREPSRYKPTALRKCFWRSAQVEYGKKYEKNMRKLHRLREWESERVREWEIERVRECEREGGRGTGVKKYFLWKKIHTLPNYNCLGVINVVCLRPLMFGLCMQCNAMQCIEADRGFRCSSPGRRQCRSRAFSDH